MSQNTVSSEQMWEAFREHRKESERKLLETFLRTETAEKDVSESHEIQDQLVAAEKRRSLPLELLAEEWLREEYGDVATKTYLMDKLLPTLILGLEKLLTEVSERGLEDTETTQYDFNPINLLAQYLMRNNPLHTTLPETHPYCMKLRQVSEQLKQTSTVQSPQSATGGNSVT